MTTSNERHLNEDERQGVADGSLASASTAFVFSHLDSCPDCAADVDHLRMLMVRVRTAPVGGDRMAELWPGIRARIEQSKIVALDPPLSAARTSDSPAPLLGTPGRAGRWWIAGVAAAAVAVALILPRIGTHVAGDATGSAGAGAPASPFTSVSDSSLADEQEANTLLNELEMQRALMRPQTAAALDRNLRTLDSAITEVKSALANDPNNPSLRRLLAASLRQKVELLRRANRAG